jgi:fructokinase
MQSDRAGVLVGVELGGTKIVMASSADGLVLDARERLPTTEPDKTLKAIRASVENVSGGESISAIGIASFGPIDLRRSSGGFGRLISTPKPGWSGIDVVGGITVGFDAPFAADTDVNAAVIAERHFGAGIDFDHVLYLTVGTGLGGGVWSDGRVIHGANHSEIGHIRVPRQPGDDHVSSCPFHSDCLEGMASGTAMKKRWGSPADELGSDTSAATHLEARYLASGIAVLCSVVPVEAVIIGGGVSKLPRLHEYVAESLSDASGTYPPVPFAEGGPLIVPPGLGDDSGVRGAIELAKLARAESEARPG